ncbi:MAG: HAMP domain-containing histidine kinase [Flavobacteriales bacterium]|nr:HAMP domain-containing histidine kinase [Flavobacteriales bacterium]
MDLYQNFRVTRFIGFLVALLLVVLVIYVSNTMVKQLEHEEEQKVKTLAEAQRIIGSNIEIEPNFQFFLLSIIEQNNSVPVIVTDKNKNPIFMRNVSEDIESDSEALQEEIMEMESTYEPIAIELGDIKQFLYYKNSDLHYKLQYYPIFLIVIISIFIWFTLWYFKNLKRTEESFLWAGMAKETAHQIGTPLSSMMGWLELLKMEDVNEQAVGEMEHDISRLNVITERFSKIGSKPELKENDLIEVIQKTIDYLRVRISSSVQIKFESKLQSANIKLNEALLSWVLENLMKNAVDAMKSKGEITVKVEENQQNYLIDVSDTGSGISLRKKNDIFKPGFTTKKRGWGLGLSLAKRIIEKYHNGKIYVLKSIPNKGTTFRIEFSKNG